MSIIVLSKVPSKSKIISFVIFFLKKVTCAVDWHNVYIILYRNQNTSVMNNLNTIACVSAMVSSDSNYQDILAMISEMDLELLDVVSCS